MSDSALYASPVGSAGTSCTWEWENTSSFADSGPRRGPGEEDWTGNQTVFLRGYKVAIRSRPSRLRKPCTTLSVVDSKPAHILSRSGFIPFSQSSPPSPSGFFRSAPSGSGSASDDQHSVEYFPQTPDSHHPASAINEYLLASHPDVDVAVTHDDDWTSVMYPNAEGMPSDCELIERISHRYQTGTSSDGVWLHEDPTQIGPNPSVHPGSSFYADRRGFMQKMKDFITILIKILLDQGVQCNYSVRKPKSESPLPVDFVCKVIQNTPLLGHVLGILSVVHSTAPVTLPLLYAVSNHCESELRGVLDQATDFGFIEQEGPQLVLAKNFRHILRDQEAGQKAGIIDVFEYHRRLALWALGPVVSDHATVVLYASHWWDYHLIKSKRTSELCEALDKSGAPRSCCSSKRLLNVIDWLKTDPEPEPVKVITDKEVLYARFTSFWLKTDPEPVAVKVIEDMEVLYKRFASRGF